MKLAQVVGSVVLSKCIDQYAGHVLHLVRDLNRAQEAVGDAEVCATWQAMSQGDRVIVEVAREAANAFAQPQPVDAVILGKVDHVKIESPNGKV
jgi:microcompartment protein CcmK/EutM